MMAQQPFTLKLHNDAQLLGVHSTVYTDTVTVMELPIGLAGKVSSLEVADGFVVSFYATDDLDGPQKFTLKGPAVIKDLSIVPMNSTRANWNNAIASFRISPASKSDNEYPTPELAQGQEDRFSQTR